MLETILYVIHVLICIAIIVTVLLQSGKSAGLSGTIAGGAETFFGKKKGMDELLSKITAGIAVVLLITSITLAILGK